MQFPHNSPRVSSGAPAEFARSTVPRESMMEDRVRISQVESGDALIFGKHWREYLDGFYVGCSQRSDMPILFLIEHGYLRFTSPTPQDFHRVRFYRSDTEIWIAGGRSRIPLTIFAARATHRNGMIQVDVDFNNCDTEERVRLNTAGATAL